MEIILTAMGFTQTNAMLTGIQSDMDENLWKLLLQLMHDIVDEARNILQNNQHINTGELLASVRILQQDQPNLRGVVGSDVKQAIFIEFGRGPVHAKPGKTLHWIDKTTGEDVFATFARPTEASPFLRPAVVMHTRQFRDVFVEFMMPKTA